MKANLLESAFSLFLALLITVGVAIGIEVFYPQQPFSEIPPPTSSEQIPAVPIGSPAAFEEHTRNASLIGLVAATVSMVLGLTFDKKYSVFNSAFVLAGVFLTLFSTMRGLPAGDSRFSFQVVVLVLLLSFGLGYKKFVTSK